MSFQGRIPLIDKSVVIDTLLRHQTKILLPGDKIVSKRDIVWTQISDELNKKKSNRSLYTLVCNNKFGIRDLLNNRPPQIQSVELNSSAINSSLNSTIEANDVEGVQNVTLSMSRHSFDAMLTEKVYKGRFVKKLKPGVWQREVCERLWNATKLKCGFHFKYHHINNDITSGSIKGKCTCGTGLKVFLQASTSCVKFHCTISLKKGTCGKRQLRQPYRREVAESLKHKSAELYRIECAAKLMSPGDAEPPFLPKASTLNMAKHEMIDKLSFDKDPIVAIAKMKRVGETNAKLAIRHVGYDPFYVFYWTNQQSLIYKKYADSGFSSLKIDASGSLVSKILRADGSFSQHIFLYLAVIHYGSGQTSVNQMLSEAHDTATIQNWLTQWLRSGVLPPSETVCDSSRALLTAIVRTFTGLQTIEKYCDEFLADKLPPCFIRIDVNHFLKIYANLLKQEHRLIKKFYMGVIGQIVLASNLSVAREIIKSALIVSLSETEGQSPTNANNPCDRYKEHLFGLITAGTPIPEIEHAINSEIPEDPTMDESSEPEESNSWEQWAQALEEEIKAQLEDGVSPNAHFCPVFSKHLLKDLKHLPMWSCVYRDQFGFGRIPATSAPVEGEFNKIKNVIFGNEGNRKRVDRFLEQHIEILNGQTNLVQANLASQECAAEGITSPSPPPLTGTVTSTEPPTTHPPILSPDDQVTCVACKNGDAPSGAHTCIICFKFVHILEGCSVPHEGETEGYGEKRMCQKCHQSNAATHILPTRYEENWKGQVTGPKRQKNRPSLYLGNEDHLRDALLFEKNLKFPILKNGSLGVGQTMMTCLRTHKNTNHSVVNTCAFDALLQVLLSVGPGNQNWTEFFEGSNNPFLQLLGYIAKNGLRGPTVYQKRTRLLCQELANDQWRFKTINNCTVANCVSGIGKAVKHAFRDDPSCKELSMCTTGCTKICKIRTLLNLTFEEMARQNFDVVIQEKLSLEDQRCVKCGKTVFTTITSLGKLMFFEVLDADLHLRIPISTIPTAFTISINDEFKEFVIAGIVEFKEPFKSKLRKNKTPSSIEQEIHSNSNAVGHYTALCPRPGGRWSEYDDLRDKEKTRNGSFECCPSLIIYKLKSHQES